MKFATICYNGDQLYGAVTDKGFIALSDDFPEWRSLKEVIEHSGLSVLEAPPCGSRC